jgi:hypothetical protein
LGDGLVRIFHFDNVSKTWTFFGPREEFASANTLKEFIPGQPYWVRAGGDAVEVNTSVPLSLNCVNPGTSGEDCWNLIVWP